MPNVPPGLLAAPASAPAGRFPYRHLRLVPPSTRRRLTTARSVSLVLHLSAARAAPTRLPTSYWRRPILTRVRVVCCTATQAKLSPERDGRETCVPSRECR